jgi:hypothetical protein
MKCILDGFQALTLFVSGMGPGVRRNPVNMGDGPAQNLRVPIRVIAATHDTSVQMIEKHYSRRISEHSHEIARRGLLHDDEPTATNIIGLRLECR